MRSEILNSKRLIKFMCGTEVKIFLTFLFIFSLFSYWTGWMEYSSLDLTRAVVDEGRFEIDSYYNNTGDRSFYEGHYYSNKAPGLSFLSTPVYLAWKGVYSLFYAYPDEPSLEYNAHELGNVTVINYVDPGPFTRISMILVTLISSLLSALTVVLVYKTLGYFTKRKKYRMFLALIFGLVTPVFVYGRTFTSNSVGMFFIFSCFYILLKARKEKTDKKYLLLAGLLGGFAVVVDYWTVLILLPLIFYALVSERKRFVHIFLLGIVLGGLPLLLYNYSIFQNPLEFTFQHQDPEIWVAEEWKSASGSMGFSPDTGDFHVLLRVLFFPYRGLFFYYPVLLLSFAGLYYMYRKQRTEALFILSIFVIFAYANSVYWYWWGGFVFGPRFMLPMIPFLTLPLLFVMEKVGLKEKKIWIGLAILCLFSFSMNLLSLNDWEEKIVSVPGMGMDEEYRNKINSLEILYNPLGYYFESSSTGGIRSRIIETLLDPHRKLDIRHDVLTETGRTPLKHVPLTKTFFGFLNLNTAPFALFLTLLTLFAIWREEVNRAAGKMKLPPWAPLVFLAVLLVSCLSLSNMIYENNWHQPESWESMNYRWMSQNASISLFVPPNYEKPLGFEVWSYHKPRNLTIYIGHRNITVEKISGTRLITIPPAEYENFERLMFRSEDGCEVVKETEGRNDPRCLSFAFVSAPLYWDDIIDRVHFGNNWYFKERHTDLAWRWMSNDASVYIYKEKTGAERLELELWSYYKPRNLRVTLNGEVLGEYAIDPVIKKSLVMNLNLKEGENEIKFRSMESCDVPSRTEDSTDRRCLSFAFSKVELE